MISGKWRASDAIVATAMHTKVEATSRWRVLNWKRLLAIVGFDFADGLLGGIRTDRQFSTKELLNWLRGKEA